MLFRSFFSVSIVLATVASAAAQTAPVKKTTKTTSTARATTSRSTTMQSQSAAKATPGGRNDIGPAGNGAVGSTENADGKGQNAYAAPGMPVNVDNPKKVEGYNGPAPTKSRTGTTLSPR
ncbi:hypothetical protein [Hymenobacter negativus]|uniref:Uncharacterized protein n=1 Tax=Hymenobacter negativus TaxID=2795026 RepID=A0ABS3QI27_9BACT|nr:hypothetical protein [Hymenobacter negativus]MBO2010449.1 hypothetical protein [Hymenobacter negativus]